MLPKKKKENPIREVDMQVSSIEFAPKTQTKITFPYTVQKEDKVEIVPEAGVWILKEFLEHIKEIWWCDPSSMTKHLLRHLLGPQNLKYMNLAGDGERGTIPMPESVYFGIRLFVMKNCSTYSALSTYKFNKWIKKTFDDARKLEKSVCTNNSYNKSERISDKEPKSTSIVNSAEIIVISEDESEETTPEIIFISEGKSQKATSGIIVISQDEYQETTSGYDSDSMTEIYEGEGISDESQKSITSSVERRKSSNDTYSSEGQGKLKIRRYSLRLYRRPVRKCRYY